MSTIRERNKALILRAASEEFADKGFAASKTSDIAAKAGVPKPNVYYYFKSKENLYREVLESIIERIMQASTPFNREGVPAEVLSSYIHAKIRISRDLPFASKVFASEIMHGAPHLTTEQVEQLNKQARHNIDCIEGWISEGLVAPLDAHHLMFTLWAATQTYADFDWQIARVTGKLKLDDADYEAAAKTIIRMVLKGCEPDRSSTQRALQPGLNCGAKRPCGSQEPCRPHRVTARSSKACE